MRRAQRRTAVWDGRGATTRPREAKWNSGVAAIFWVDYYKIFSKIHLAITTTINTSTTEEHYRLRIIVQALVHGKGFFYTNFSITVPHFAFPLLTIWSWVSYGALSYERAAGIILQYTRHIDSSFREDPHSQSGDHANAIPTTWYRMRTLLCIHHPARKKNTLTARRHKFQQKNV